MRSSPTASLAPRASSLAHADMVAARARSSRPMCSDPDSSPPIEPDRDDPRGRSPTSSSRPPTATGSPAYRADAPEPTGAGMLVLPDYHGLTPFYERAGAAVRRGGVDALAIDYYGRTAEPPPRDRSFDHVSHADRTTWAGLQSRRSRGCRRTASEAIASAPCSPSGFCFGGRTSFLLGTLPELEMAGVIGFYGWPVGPIRNDTPAPADLPADWSRRSWASSVALMPRSRRRRSKPSERALDRGAAQPTVSSATRAPRTRSSTTGMATRRGLSRRMVGGAMASSRPIA